VVDYLARYDTRAKSAEGEWLTLTVPGTVEVATNPATGEPLRLKVIGPDNPERQDLIDEINRRTQRLSMLSTDGKPVSSKVLWGIQHEVFAQAVKDWSGFDEPFTTGNVAALFDRFRAFFLQADNFSSARAGFLPRTAPNGSAPAPDAPNAVSGSPSGSPTEAPSGST
jgi:hypothetical protein